MSDDDRDATSEPAADRDRPSSDAVEAASERPRRPAARTPGAGRELVRGRRLPPAGRRNAPSPPAVATEPYSWTGPTQAVQVLIESQRERRRRFLLRLALFSGLPTLLTLCYMLFVASPRYVSEFEITYQTYQPPQSLSVGLVQSLFGASTTGTIDLSTILYEYIRSEALASKLDKELHLRAYYSSPKVDYFSRMDPHANEPTFMRYYLWYISASEGWGGYLTVDVQAFDPDYAYRVAQAIVKACDQMVDKLTDRAAQDEVRYAQDTVNEAEARVKKARLAMTDFQNRHGILNPPVSANQIGGVVGTLEGALATAQTQLATLIATAPRSPQVATTKAQIASLEAQLAAERQRLANRAGSDAYSKLLDQYSALELEQEFAKTAYLSAQQGLAVARADAAHKQIYLVDFAPPYRPDKQNIEFAAFYTLTALIVSLVLFGIGSLIAGAMRDQAGL